MFSTPTTRAASTPREFENAPWSWPKLVDFFSHLIVPLLILGLGGMAGTFRIMRANLMDVLNQQYVETARAKGLAERIVIYKHAARIAINPLISRLGMQLPVLLGGTIILSIVLDLPTLGPPFYRALLRQDMFLAGTILMILAVTLLVGNFIADLLLAWSDRGYVSMTSPKQPRPNVLAVDAVNTVQPAQTTDALTTPIEASAGLGEFRLLSVRQLMWRKFARNRMALLSGAVLILLYLGTIFAGFVAPYGVQNGDSTLSFAPPVRVRRSTRPGDGPLFPAPLLLPAGGRARRHHLSDRIRGSAHAAHARGLFCEGRFVPRAGVV